MIPGAVRDIAKTHEFNNASGLSKVLDRSLLFDDQTLKILKECSPAASQRFVPPAPVSSRPVV